MKIPLTIAAVLVITGCANKYSVTYDSFPQSAVVVCNGVQKGYTPLTLNYTVDQNNQNINTVKCDAVWASGVKSEFKSEFDSQKHPKGAVTSVMRPKEKIDELKSDLEFDYKRKQSDEITQQKEENLRIQRAINTQFYFDYPYNPYYWHPYRPFYRPYRYDRPINNGFYNRPNNSRPIYRPK